MEINIQLLLLLVQCLLMLNSLSPPEEMFHQNKNTHWTLKWVIVRSYCSFVHPAPLLRLHENSDWWIQIVMAIQNNEDSNAGVESTESEAACFSTRHQPTEHKCIMKLHFPNVTVEMP